jgi:hypothetical protein
MRNDIAESPVYRASHEQNSVLSRAWNGLIEPIITNAYESWPAMEAGIADRVWSIEELVVLLA